MILKDLKIKNLKTFSISVKNKRRLQYSETAFLLEKIESIKIERLFHDKLFRLRLASVSNFYQVIS